MIERYAPEWARAVSDESRTLDGVTVAWHDVVRDGDVFSAAVTYTVDDHSWTQHFSGAVVDDAQLVANRRAAGLVFDAWLDAPRKWARFVRGSD